MRLRKALIVAFLVGSSAPIVAADADDPMPGLKLRNYETLSIRFSLGTLWLSDHFAAFTRLKGHMDLKFWDVERDSPDDGLSGAQIFRITNAREYFLKNKGTNGYCDRAPKWLVVHKLEPMLPYILPGEVELFFIDVDDMRQFRWTKPGLCMIVSYRVLEDESTGPI